MGLTSASTHELDEDAILGDPSARPAALRVEAREDLVAARAALEAIGSGAG
jgi:hypothetical protein